MKRAVVLVISILLCLIWVRGTWPGSNTGGKFYAYPITPPLVAIWIAGCTVIMVIAYFLLRKKRK